MQSFGKPEADAKFAVDEKKSAAPLLTSYTPLSYLEVRREIEMFQAVYNASLEEWHREVSMYEETFSDLDASTSQTVEFPRRNYPNDECKVKDTKLYPYHNACYLLIDAYSPATARENFVLERTLPGQLLCSVDSIHSTITGLTNQLEASAWLPSSFQLAFALRDEWVSGVARRLAASDNPDCWKSHEPRDFDFADKHQYGLAHFPVDDEARGDILLKLLRHAMSDLQNDLLLAGEVIVRICRWKLCQDACYLRRVLAVVVSEAKECTDGTCFAFIWDGGFGDPDDGDLPDHSCKDWLSFRKKLSFMISVGIKNFTAEHAQVIAAVMQAYFDEANQAAAKLEAAAIEEALNPTKNQSLQAKNRALLKQKLFLSNNTYCYDDVEDSDGDEDEEEDTTPRQQDWTDDIVAGLVANAILASRRVTEIRDIVLQKTTHYNPDALVILLRTSIDSFHNITRCLVSIGEASLRRLPNNPKVVGLSSRLVLGMTCLFIKPDISLFDHEKVDIGTYLKGGPSLIDPNRYADSVLNATKNYRQRHFPDSTSAKGYDDASNGLIKEADSFLRALPDQAVQDLVRCFFTRDLVDPLVSRCGYGDIQVWWGIPITPLDPLLFFNSCNSPSDSAIENAWATDSEEAVAWERDEEGQDLWGDELVARYDFTLLLLLWAWQLPWSIDSHHSFQKPFRDAVTTLFLCANRMHMPTDIAAHVCTYLRRDWWPDERRRCFDKDCLEKRSMKLIQQKLLSNAASSASLGPKRRAITRSHRSCTACPECLVALYCCEEHRQSSYRDGHKVVCAKPPCRVPGYKEKLLFQDVLSLQTNESIPPILNDRVKLLMESQLHDETDFVDDDSGSWESVDTEEDEESGVNESLTSVVHAFFDKECYRGQRNVDDS